jgi:hypothetical protein
MGNKLIFIIKIMPWICHLLRFVNPHLFSFMFDKKKIYLFVFGPGLATGPVLTSDKEEKHNILPTTLNFAVRMGRLCIYTLQNPPVVIW